MSRLGAVIAQWHHENLDYPKSCDIVRVVTLARRHLEMNLGIIHNLTSMPQKTRPSISRDHVKYLGTRCGFRSQRIVRIIILLKRFRPDFTLDLDSNLAPWIVHILTLARITDSANVMNADMVYGRVVKFHVKGADKRRDCQIELCICHPAETHMSPTISGTCRATIVQNTYWRPMHCLLPLVKLTRYLPSGKPSLAACIHRSGLKECGSG